jgi:uncharacterized protein YodC (DUF2158 family)
MKRTFKIGDTVALKSADDPLMTVLAIDRNGVTCAWSVKGDIKTKIFSDAALRNVDKPMTLEQLVSASYKKRKRLAP